jgi:hypothetical protein
MSIARQFQLPTATYAPEDSPDINGSHRFASESVLAHFPGPQVYRSAAVSLVLPYYLACGLQPVSPAWSWAHKIPSIGYQCETQVLQEAIQEIICLFIHVAEISDLSTRLRRALPQFVPFNYFQDISLIVSSPQNLVVEEGR